MINDANNPLCFIREEIHRLKSEKDELISSLPSMEDDNNSDYDWTGHTETLNRIVALGIEIENLSCISNNLPLLAEAFLKNE